MIGLSSGTWLERDYHQSSNIWGILIIVWQVKGDIPFKGDGNLVVRIKNKKISWFYFTISKFSEANGC